MRSFPYLLLGICFVLAVTAPSVADKEETKPKSTTTTEKEKLKLLIMDGQNNHSTWPKTTFMMKQYFEDSGLFEVDIARTAFTWNGNASLMKEYPLEGVKTVATKTAQTDPNFKPDFSKYDVVVSNFGYGAADWPEETKKAFDQYVRDGGGLVIVHAADNSFGDWTEYNEMIGVGGWGGRNEKTGPYVYLNDDGEEVRDTSKRSAGSHGPMHEFQIIVRDETHPITDGMPVAWMHASDELYDYLRGPAVNMKILATALSAKDKSGSGNHVPMMITVDYGKGRVFHTPMGHDDGAMECVGFATTLIRGGQWAATGEVTIPVPDDFPTDRQSSTRDK